MFYNMSLPNWTNCDRSPRGDRATAMVSLGILTGAVCVIGTLGNGLNLALMVKRVVRQRFARDKGVYVGFIFLALSDSFVCLVSLPRIFIRESKILFDSVSFPLYYQRFGAGITSVFILWSTWMTVLLAIGRCLAVCDPLSRRILFHVSSNWAVITSIVSFVAALLFHIPSLMLYEASPFVLPTVTCYIVSARSYWDKINDIHDWLRIVLGYFIPFIILLFCNGYLIVALRRSEKVREELAAAGSNNRKRLSNKITPTLLAIIIAFLALMTPSEILELVFEKIQDSATKGKTYFLVRQIANFLQITNFAMNFALHMGINRMYRKALHDFCARACPCRRRSLLARQTSSDTRLTAGTATTTSLHVHSTSCTV